MFPWLDPAPAAPRRGAAGVPLVRRARDEVLAQILAGHLAPGQRINEPDIADRLGVSRVPVREALRSLEASGLVVARKNAGVFVRRLEPAEVADLYAFRAALDGFAARRAAALPAVPRRALARALSRSQAAMRRAARRHEVESYYAQNLAFHWAIVEAADNGPLAESYRGVVQRLHLWRLRNLSHPVGMAASIAEHAAIAAAIAAGEPARAETLLAAHVGAAFQRLMHIPEKESP
jgi:DNA-binding GntR family transcriptional regulator